MKPHIISIEQLEGTFQTLLAANSESKKGLWSLLEINEGYSVYFEVWHNGTRIERTQQIGTAIRRYNAL